MIRCIYWRVWTNTRSSSRTSEPPPPQKTTTTTVAILAQDFSIIPRHFRGGLGVCDRRFAQVSLFFPEGDSAFVACWLGMSKVFDCSLSAHKMCKFNPVVFSPSHCYGMWCPALPSLSVVLGCAVSAPLLLLAFVYSCVP